MGDGFPISRHYNDTDGLLQLPFVLYQYDSPGDTLVNTTFAAGDCFYYSHDTFASTTYTSQGNLTPVHIANGLYRVPVIANKGEEDTFIMVIDQSNPKLWGDIIIRVQNFGKDGSTVTYKQAKGDKFPGVDLQAIGASTAFLAAFKALSQTWYDVVVDATPTPTVTAFECTSDPLGGGGDASVKAMRGRSMIFLDGKLTGRITSITDYNFSTYLVTYKAVEVAPLSSERVVIF